MSIVILIKTETKVTVAADKRTYFSNNMVNPRKKYTKFNLHGKIGFLALIGETGIITDLLSNFQEILDKNLKGTLLKPQNEVKNKDVLHLIQVDILDLLRAHIIDIGLLNAEEIIRSVSGVISIEGRIFEIPDLLNVVETTDTGIASIGIGSPVVKGMDYAFSIRKGNYTVPLRERLGHTFHLLSSYWGGVSSEHDIDNYNLLKKE